MRPPDVAGLLESAGHDATTPAMLGAHNLPDDILVQLAASEGRVIITENAQDFAATSTCTVLLVRKSWWPTKSLAGGLAVAAARWATDNPDPGPWAHWLAAQYR